MPAPAKDALAGHRSTRSFPRLVASAVRLAWQSAPGALCTAFALQVANAAGTVVQLLVAEWLLSEILDSGSSHISLSHVWPALVVLVFVTTAMQGTAIVQSTVGMVLSEAIAVRATGQVLDVATTVEPHVYDDPDFHDRLERARFNAGARPVIAVNGLLGVLGAVLGAAGAAIAILWIEPLLIPLAMLGAVPAFLASATNSRRYHEFTRRQTTDDRRRSYLLHLMSNRDQAKELRIYGIEAELRRRHDDLHGERLALVRSLARSRRRVAVLASVGTAIGLLISLSFLFWSVEHDRIDLAGAGTALFALLYLGQRMRGFVGSSATLYEAALFIDDVEDFRDLGEYTEDEAGEVIPLPPFRALRSERLGFVYPGADVPALVGVDVVLRKGETVAIVGENGSGKTTLAKLLTGIYQPTSGTICWDGLDLANEDPARLRRSVGIVFQDYSRFQLSAHDNVALGDIARQDDISAIGAAAADAGADEVVELLPQGWKTILSKLFPEGVDVSGGQWQRLALARALFRNAPFLVMDEPSAALDARGEAALFGRIREVAADRTVLFISHRFSTVKLADRIYVLHHGRVVETGTHQSLMQVNGRYAEMYRLQASMYALEAED